MSGLFDQITNYSPPLLTAGQVNYKGTWSAAANSPTLVDPPAATSKGDYYVVSAAGTQFSISFAVGDWIISNGTAWEKVDLTDAVSSVFGRTGAVVGASTDYSSVGLTNTAIGASNPSTGAFTTVTASSTIAATGAVTGSNLSGTHSGTSSGTNTGDQTITLTGGVTGSGTGSFAATVVTNANLTGAITSVGNATSLGSFTSANLAAALTDETGSGAAVFATSPTIVTPVIAQINDASGNETLKLASIASAVNEVTIENAATGNAVHISATGGDASVGLHLAGKGASGYVNVQDSVDATKRIMFNASGGTTNTRTMLSSTQTVDRTISLPDATDTLVGKATTDTLTNKTLTSPTLTTPVLGTPSSGTLTSCTGLPISTGVSGLGTGIATALAVNTGSAGAPVLFNGALGTPTSGTVTNLTGTASININGTVGATTPSTGAFTSVDSTGTITSTGTATQFRAKRTGQNADFRILQGVNNTVLDNNNGDELNLAIAGTYRATLSATGLAVTGALSSTGLITSGTGNSTPAFTANGATTGWTAATFINSGGTSYFGTEASVGGTLVTGSTAYDALIRTHTGLSISTNGGNGTQVRISSTGLAVTGALSSTTGANFATSSGSVGIGTASPAAKLHISGTNAGIIFDRVSADVDPSGIQGSIYVKENGISNYEAMLFRATGYRWQSDTGTDRMLIDSSGNLLVGTTSAGGKLVVTQGASSTNAILVDIASSTTKFAEFTFTGSNVGSISYNGTLTVYSTTSDYRLKNITGPLVDSGSFIDALKPKVGTWKSDGSKFVGFLAHEFAEVSPSSVNGEKDAMDAEGNPKYQGMQAGTAEVIANLVAELQSLRQRVAALESN